MPASIGLIFELKITVGYTDPIKYNNIIGYDNIKEARDCKCLPNSAESGFPTGWVVLVGIQREFDLI